MIEQNSSGEGGIGGICKFNLMTSSLRKTSQKSLNHEVAPFLITTGDNLIIAHFFKNL